MEHMGKSWAKVQKCSRITAPCNWMSGLSHLHEAGANIQDDHILRNKFGILERIHLRFFWALSTLSLYNLYKYHILGLGTIENMFSGQVNEDQAIFCPCPTAVLIIHGAFQLQSSAVVGFAAGFPAGKSWKEVDHTMGYPWFPAP